MPGGWDGGPAPDSCVGQQHSLASRMWRDIGPAGKLFQIQRTLFKKINLIKMVTYSYQKQMFRHQYIGKILYGPKEKVVFQVVYVSGFS